MTTTIDPRLIRRIADMHALYRMFDHEGKLLYVGITGHVARFDNHATKRWFPCVASITLEWCDTEAAARAAERRAIQTERPRYNIAGRAAPGKGINRPVMTTRGPLADVLRIFSKDERGLHWTVVAERLADNFPDQWAAITSLVVSAQCRSLGVPSVSVKMSGRVLNGCRRADVAEAAKRYA
jgi:hypothetical protein